jgi:signal recognition particle subunit SRP54
MLDILSDGFRQAKDRLRGKTTLSEENINDAISDIRRSLLEADVEYGVAKKFLERVKEEALGQTVQTKAGKGTGAMRVSAGDHFVKICQTELENLMGPVDSELVIPGNRPATIMMVGLQGAGKTTTTGKLTRYLIDRKKRKPLLVAADIYRPAAVDQLKILGNKVGVPVFHLPDTSPVQICKEAVKKAYELGCDTIIFDTAGRLTIDDQLMKELDDIKAATNPDNILLVCDAMMGQDAVQTAKAFNERLSISGVVMTKLDGDARGGAALSIKEVTGAPIKFLGMGEDLERLEEFRPEGLASRILGMGDVVGLMQDFERVAKEDQEESAMRMLQGQFSFNDFYEQLSMIQKMGPLKDIMAKLPIGNMLPKGLNVDDRELTKIKAMIDSMTKQERVNPKLFNDSRVRRVAKGSGRNPKDVQELIKRFGAMRQMMGMMGKNMGLLGKIPGMGQLGQLSQMKKMASEMQKSGGGGLGGMVPPGLGGMGGMGGLADMFGGGAGGGIKRPVDRDKQKKLRKEAKKARKKNRKK